MVTIFRDTHFESKVVGHGGNRRTKQIEEILERAGINLIDIQSFERKTVRDKLIILLENFIDVIVMTFRLFPFWKNALISILKGHRIKSVLRSHKSKKLIIWEDSLNFFTIHQALKNRYNIVAIPQNFDSFAMQQNMDIDSFQRNLHFLKQEIEYLMRTDAIFCISREEQWFLRACGVNSQYLPYYPPDSVLNDLLRIRSQRTLEEENAKVFSDKPEWLILGTYNNLPTKTGMIELVKILNQVSSEVSIKVNIAGYGTERIVEEIKLQSDFNLLGSLSEEKLFSIMTNTKGIIIHQKQGLGSLTKIPEMLIAGIPILANDIAARSYYGYDGLYIYQDQQALAKLLTNDFSMPKMVERPLGYERCFMDCVSKLLL